jgi:formylglycine-generating enzyme required for sulfatase activity
MWITRLAVHLLHRVAWIGTIGAYAAILGLGILVAYWSAEATDDFGFDPDNDRVYRNAGAAPGDSCDASLEPRYTTDLGIVLVRIPPGRFIMGSPSWELDRHNDERPHVVKITRPFHLAIHEVTVAQFRRFVEETGYVTDVERETAAQEETGSWRRPGFPQEENHPAVWISWNDALAFCRWLSRRERGRFRLPTEAEWEYACRAGTVTPFSFGQQTDHTDQANCHDRATESPSDLDWQDDHPFTAPVGVCRANRWGLHDMHGNAYEWCSDWYDERYYCKSPTRNPEGPSAEEIESLHDLPARVLRGGSHSSAVAYARSANRAPCYPHRTNCGIGFRIAMDTPE